MNKQLIIIGASGHGKVVADIAWQNGYEEISFLDDNPQVKACGSYPVIGTTQDATGYKTHDFIVAIGNGSIRKKIQQFLAKNGLQLVTLIHPAAVVAEDVQLGAGTVVMAGAVINPAARLGDGCIVNTCASVDHDCDLADYVHISVGAHVAGCVRIGEETWIGAGAIVSNGLQLCRQVLVGAGAVVVRDLTEPGTYIGVPAKKQNRAAKAAEK